MSINRLRFLSWIVASFAIFPLSWGVTGGMVGTCQAYFSPGDHLASRLIDLIDQEEESIRVAIYSINHAKIANALIRAKRRGVDVEVLVDPFSVKKRSSIHALSKAKIPLFVWDENLSIKKGKSKARMRQKFVVFGNKKVWTGSFDFDHDANLRHHCDGIVIKSRALAAKYAACFVNLQLYESRSFVQYCSLYPKKKK